MVSDQLDLLKPSNTLMIATASQIAKMTEISTASVNRILKHYLKLYPYKIRISQAITESDMSQRMEFAQLIITNMKMLDNIFLADEAYFRTDGCVNLYNMGVRCCIFQCNPKSTKSKFLKNLFQPNKTGTDHYINKIICLLKLLNFFIYAIKINSHEFSIIKQSIFYNLKF